MTSDSAIVFGGVTLLSSDLALGDYEIDVCADGTNYGNPEAVIAEVASMLMDGVRKQVTHFGERVVTLKVRIRSNVSLDAVTAGSLAIEAEVNKGRNTLVWTPPGWATPGTFDVTCSVFDFDPDGDLAETKQNTRYFTLTLYCSPFPRRAEPTVVTAVAIPDVMPSETEIDDCTSLTGWASVYGTLSLVGGGIRSTIASTPYWEAERNALGVSVGSERFLTIELGAATTTGAEFLINGASVVPSAVELLSGGGVRYYLPIAAPITTLNAVAVAGDGGPMVIARLAKTDQLPYIGSKMQRSFSLTIGGSARTPVDIAVESDSAAVLGTDVLLFTAPEGAAVAPGMRQWLTSGSTPVSSFAAVSGYYNPLSSANIYQRPVRVTPPGTYKIMARLVKSGGATTLMTWTASTIGHDNYTIAETETDAVIVDVTGSYEFYELGVVTLPPSQVSPDSGASIRFQLTSSDAGVRIDDVWLFNLDVGVLSWAKSAGLGVVGSRFAALSATIDRDDPAWVSGTAGTIVQDVDISRLMESNGVHQLPPGTSDVFLITTAATDQDVTATFYERFRHHVPPLAS